uniref:Uncharacterized protein n=1 Tax=Opuntia streptacantha TaxID=393608 RepID=A0A7C9E0H1_OPUST
MMHPLLIVFFFSISTNFFGIHNGSFYSQHSLISSEFIITQFWSPSKFRHSASLWNGKEQIEGDGRVYETICTKYGRKSLEIAGISDEDDRWWSSIGKEAQ